MSYLEELLPEFRKGAKIRKLLCWLGLHKWIYSGNCSINDCPLYKSCGPTVCVWQDGSGNMNWCKNKQKCKYCNKPRV